MINALPKLIVRAAWAPIAVLVFHNLIARTPLRQPLDFFMHFLGGASMAFFLLTMLELFPMVFGAVSAFGRYIFAYALACTVGVFWEFLEFFTDTYWHTHVQQSLHETMSDLVADAVGAAAALAFVCVCRCLPLWFKQRLASKG
jgi:hypothetical protein